MTKAYKSLAGNVHLSQGPIFPLACLVTWILAAFPILDWGSPSVKQA